ncbi:alpha/beta fold hydrolase [Marinobacteraceae bacterium S3BR75-40.1]
MKTVVLSLTVLALTLLQGCASNHSLPFAGVNEAAPLEATYFDVEIPTHDGKTLTATVYQPALEAGESAPLVVQTHGFGGFRSPRPMSIYGQLIVSGEAGLAAWRAGYWMISYDQRGFGDSDGQVHLMDPDFEVADLSDVIDWAQDNLPRLERDGPQDPVVGTVGESYGGAVQILASMRDPRIDAIVPIATWYNLEESIAPQKTVRSAWGSFLASFGTFSSGFDFDMFYQDQYLALFGGSMNSAVATDLARRSPATYCDAGQTVQADALFMQGFRDSLFAVNQGYHNWQCARRSGHEARLIGLRDGHILPWPMQLWSGLPMFNTQPTVHCGDRQMATRQLVVAWFDRTLRGQRERLAQWPELCVTFDDDSGEAVTELPTGGHTLPIRPSQVKLVQSGLFESILAPLDSLWSLFVPAGDPLPAEQQENSGGWLRPTFIPLLETDRAKRVVGIPVLDLDLETTTSAHDGAVFVALGIQHSGQVGFEVLGEQYVPLVGDGHYHLDMPAVADRLRPGDTLGLVAQGFTGQFFLSAEGFFSSATLKGQVQVPVHPVPQEAALATSNRRCCAGLSEK